MTRTTTGTIIFDGMVLLLLLLRRRAVVFFVLLLSSSSSNCWGQQAPRYTTAPNFDTTTTTTTTTGNNAQHQHSHKTYLCARQQQLYLGNNITLARALDGLDLSVVLINYTSTSDRFFFSLNENNVIDESRRLFFPIVLDELAMRAGFSWRTSFGVVSPLELLSVPVPPAGDNNSNNHNNTNINNNNTTTTAAAAATYTDLIQWQVAMYDVSVGRWDRSLARLAREISFPEGFYDSSLILIHATTSGGRNLRSLDIWSFLLPFQWSVWVMILATILATGFVYWFLENLNTSTDERILEHNPGNSVFYSAIAFTGHFEFRPQSSAAMILTFSLTLISLIIAAVYTANLASFLVARRQGDFPIETIQEAVLLGAPICIQARINALDYIVDKYPSAVLVRQPTKDDVYRGLRNGECQVAAVSMSEFEQYKRDAEFNSDCSLTWRGRVENNVPAGFVSDVDTGTLCTSLITHVFDLHLMQMKADGFIEKEWEAHLARTATQTCMEETDKASNIEDETLSLSIHEMAGIFIVHAFLMMVAVLVSLVQYFRARKRKEGQHEE